MPPRALPGRGTWVVGTADSTVPTSVRLDVGMEVRSVLTIGMPVDDSPVVPRLSWPLVEVEPPRRPPPRRPLSRPVPGERTLLTRLVREEPVRSWPRIGRSAVGGVGRGWGRGWVCGGGGVARNLLR